MISLAEAKLQIRHALDPGDTTEDALIQSLIDAAILQLEHDTGRAFRDREETLILDRWCDPVVLPWWPVQSINSIQYYNADGNEQTLASYTLDTREVPARLLPYPNSDWPEVEDRPQAITIKAQVGGTTLPESLKRAGLLLIGHLYANRESVVIGTITSEVPMAYDALVQPYRIMRLG
jgi:uncharacterized phiE125 gp8 family phage protein